VQPILWIWCIIWCLLVLNCGAYTALVSSPYQSCISLPYPDASHPASDATHWCITYLLFKWVMHYNLPFSQLPPSFMHYLPAIISLSVSQVMHYLQPPNYLWWCHSLILWCSVMH
jgi:hypothetical protein